jgi:hypothetical protein
MKGIVHKSISRLIFCRWILSSYQNFAWKTVCGESISISLIEVLGSREYIHAHAEYRSAFCDYVYQLVLHARVTR